MVLVLQVCFCALKYDIIEGGYAENSSQYSSWTFCFLSHHIYPFQQRLLREKNPTETKYFGKRDTKSKHINCCISGD